MDPVIRFLTACGATTCLASANGSGVGAPETLSWANTAVTAQQVVLAVGGASNATNGLFDLELSLGREYLLTPIAPACDPMTGGTPLAGLTGDDAVTAALDLPFPVTFFGERQLEFTVNTNGLLQLFPTLPATGANTFANVGIPTATAPNGFVAAFWDDLYPVAMVSQTTTRVIGTAPSRRFVVEWRDYSVFADRAARLTFQAKLFETSGVIELHYCALTPGMTPALATGSSATVGIESPDGRSGRQHSLNTAMAVSTATALRFTP